MHRIKHDTPGKVSNIPMPPSQPKSSKNISTRSGEIDAIKSLAIIGVIITHMSFESRFEPSTLQLVQALQLIFGWCVLAFFFCSGLLAKPVTNQQAVFKVIKKRCLRLIVPCLIFSLSYKIALSGLYLTGLFSWEPPLPQSINGILPFLVGPVGPQFYFLYYLFFTSIGVAIAEWLLGQSGLLIIMIVILPLCYATLFEIPYRGYGPELQMIPLYSFTYLSGYFLSKFKATSHSNTNTRN
ncbi:MAG: acyltransferase, partial [Merismopedia sp. SIO2A8]|nr:acyltransferase [Merismopedia sp. SIO2A8]